MPYIYRYIDKSDNIIKYVGIVYGQNRSLTQRIKEHSKEDWVKESEWEIQYIEENIASRTDAEYFESHYISLYGTYNYFNKSKAKWGLSNYLPNRENDWKSYVLYEDNKQAQDCYFPFEMWFNRIIQCKDSRERCVIYNEAVRQFKEIRPNKKFWGVLTRKFDDMISEYIFNKTGLAYFCNGHIELNIPHENYCKTCEYDLSTGLVYYTRLKKWVKIEELIACINEKSDNAIKRSESLQVVEYMAHNHKL